MTTEEKLNKAIEFIRAIEKMSLSKKTTINIVDSAHAYCEECGYEVSLNFARPNVDYVEASFFDDLKDKAWHLLFELEN